MGHEMTNIQVINGVSRLLVEEVLVGMSTTAGRRALRPKLRALLDAPTCKVCNDTKQMHEPGQEPGSCAACFEDETVQPQGEPVVWLDPESGRKASTISAALKKYNEGKGGAPASVAASYSVPLYRGWPSPATIDSTKIEPAAYRVIFNDGETSKWEDGSPQSQDLYDVRDGVIRGVQCAYAQLPEKAAPVPAEPILVEAVAVTRECDEDGLRLDWLIEGGIAALEHPGTMLLVAQGVLTNDSGNGYVYPARNPDDDE